MSIIEFPKKDEYLLNRLKNQFYTQHDDIFLQLQNVVVNHRDKTAYTLFFTYAIEQGEYDVLLDTIHYILPNIIEETENIEWDNAYLTALLQTWQLEKLSDVLQYKWQYYEQYHLDTTYLQHVQGQLEQQLTLLQQEDEEQKKKLYEKIDKVDSLSYVEQQSLLPQLHGLSDDELVRVSKTLLQATNFHCILKSYVLEHLLMKQVIDQITMNWFGENKTVCFEQLKPILETDTMRESLIQLPQNENHNILEQNMVLYLSIVYPFEKDVFETGQEWVDALEKKHLGDNSNEWLNRIEQMILNMSF